MWLRGICNNNKKLFHLSTTAVKSPENTDKPAGFVELMIHMKKKKS